MAEPLESPAAASIRKEMAARLRAASAGGRAVDGMRIVRIEVPAPEVDPLGWVGAHASRIKGYWVDREHAVEMAAIGEADEVKGVEAGSLDALFGELAERWRSSEADLRYYGGLRFGPWHARDESWRPFGAYRFILPQFELVRQGGADTKLACHVVLRPGRAPVPELLEQLAGMRFPVSFTPLALPPPLGRRDEPDLSHWQSAVRQALQAIAEGRVEKVVLARRACFQFPVPVDAFSLLRRIQQDAGRCFQFCGSHDAGLAFIGASPERLYKRVGRHVISEALAGTRARSAETEADIALASELQASAKEQREHRLVVENIEAVLKPRCRTLQVDAQPRVLKLARLQHLYSRLEGELRSDVTDADLLRSLHPTPAVGGTPAAAALPLLAALEPFDRGWYTGPVGWLSRDAAEFAVALRCGLVAGSRLCLFSGAGIVQGSEPDKEWREIEAKLGSFLNVLQAP
jgi:menaquinone-specific isochorismate synthase